MKTKICTKCKVRKSKECFLINKRYKDGYTSWCKDCFAIYGQAWHEDHIEHDRQRQANYYQENKERISVIRSARDRKRWREDTEYRERKNSQKKAKYHNDPEHKRIKLEKDRLRRILTGKTKKRFNGYATKEEWDSLCLTLNYKCARCGEVKPLVIDHIVPPELGGTHLIENLQPLCLSCNSVKQQHTTNYKNS